MKKKLHDLFDIPQSGKITDKVLFARLSVYISAIMLCLASMSYASVAFFSTSVVSESNTIQAAHFDVEIFITESSDTQQQSKDDGTRVELTCDSSNVYSAILDGGKEYAVTLRSSGTASTGFVVMAAGGNRYFTQQIDQSVGQTLVFYLAVDDTMAVSFAPHIGTSSHYEDYRNGVNDPFYVTRDDTVQFAKTASSEG